MDPESRECLSLLAEASVVLRRAASCCSNDVAGVNSAMWSQAW